MSTDKISATSHWAVLWIRFLQQGRVLGRIVFITQNTIVTTYEVTVTRFCVSRSCGRTIIDEMSKKLVSRIVCFQAEPNGTVKAWFLAHCVA